MLQLLMELFPLGYTNKRANVILKQQWSFSGMAIDEKGNVTSTERVYEPGVEYPIFMVTEKGYILPEVLSSEDPDCILPLDYVKEVRCLPVIN